MDKECVIGLILVDMLAERGRKQEEIKKNMVIFTRVTYHCPATVGPQSVFFILQPFLT